MVVADQLLQHGFKILFEEVQNQVDIIDLDASWYDSIVFVTYALRSAVSGMGYGYG